MENIPYLLLILSTWRAQLVKTRHLSKNSSNELESAEFLVQTGAQIKQSLYSRKQPQNCSSSYTSWLSVTWLRSQLAVARETAWKSKHAKAFDSPFHLRVLCWWGGGVSTRVIISPYFLFWLIRQLSKQSRVCSGIRPWLGETLCVRLITMHCFASLNISGYSHRSWPTLVSLCFQYLDQVISGKIDAAVLQAVGRECCEASETDKCQNQKWLFWQKTILPYN